MPHRTATLLLAFIMPALSGCIGDQVGPALEGATSVPTEVSAGLFASIELERVGPPGARDTLHGRATLHNRSAAPIRVVHGACSLDLHGRPAGDGADRSAPPAWRSELRQPWEGTYRHGCNRIAYTAVIAPGAHYTHAGLALRVPILELLGDSLPDGSYDITGGVWLTVGDADSGVSATGGTPLVTAPATLLLEVARPPLQARRTFDLVTWTAQPVQAVAGRLEAEVHGELTAAGGMLLELSAECALRLHVYAERALRDAAPRGGPALVTRPAACGTDTRRVTMHRGQSERPRLSIPLSAAPGVEARGTYYFALSVHTRHGQVWLDAGSAEILP